MKFVVVNGRPPRQKTRWLATAVAVLTLLLAFLNAAPGEEQPSTGVAPEFNKEDGTLYIDWSGPIVAGMADDLRAALGKYGTTLNRVVLFLDSAGGRVDDGDRVIEVLNQIKLRQILKMDSEVEIEAKFCALRLESLKNLKRMMPLCCYLRQRQVRATQFRPQ